MASVGERVAIGFAFAWLIVRANHMLPERLRVNTIGDGILALGVAFTTYGLANFARANGFIAVFTAAVTSQRFGRNLDYFQTLASAAARRPRRRSGTRRRRCSTPGE